MNDALIVNNLSKNYSNFKLKDVSFQLPQGYIMGLIGKNGSGKTTTIRCILNMIKRNSGEICIFGKDNIQDELEIKKNIGAVFDSNFFVDNWNITDVEKTVSMFYSHWNKVYFHTLLKKFHLNKNKKVKELSKGMQMKLMLACALSYDANLLILDEPTSGLDPVSRDELLEILADYIEDGVHSILFSTHITEDLDKIADYITYLNNGEVFYTGGKEEFIDLFRIVKGGPEELSLDLKNKLEGIRTFPTGFEGLIKTQYVKDYPSLLYEPATIDDIIIFTNKGEV
ncbi:ABC transporter ATP-binding protein [Clostridium sp. MB40-C1]|uniref:ABC transporter ATP-binding protein n=1 Tax=Clostridium sp. MB40-C1 TaxID=3070996 RepID=UPI0027DFC4B9|nr:ABC transporter ATP-binding protein [Clostridium sp. MB40-C1]WMJ82452.1 ABC transporter ATP-binding protein [Clostridium sp. MB40-C1]